MFRLAIFVCGLGATLSSAQVPTNVPTTTPLPGVIGQPNAAQLQMMQLGTMRAMGRSRGVQTGVANPIIGGGYGPQSTVNPTHPPTPSTSKKKKHRSLEEIKAAARAKEEQRRAAKKGTSPKKPMNVSSTK